MTVLCYVYMCKPKVTLFFLNVFILGDLVIYTRLSAISPVCFLFVFFCLFVCLFFVCFCLFFFWLVGWLLVCLFVCLLAYLLVCLFKCAWLVLFWGYNVFIVVLCAITEVT